MKRFLSTKNTFTIVILWSLVLFLLSVIFLGIKKGNIQLVPTVVICLVISLIIWVLLDTRYVIKNNFLLYRSGPFRGRIDINKIQKIQYHKGFMVPVTMKPALDFKGFIITYNKFDDVYVSPTKGEIFIKELLLVNPKIEVL